MIRIYYLDNDHDFYRDLKCWIPDDCFLHQVKIDDLDSLIPLLNPMRDIFFIDPLYTGDNRDYIQHIIRKLLPVPVILISETVSLPVVVSSVKIGAFSYLHKTEDKSHIIESLKKILFDNPPLTIPSPSDPYPEIKGSSIVIKQLKENLLSLSQKNFSVHIRGESGTGKELAVRAIHRNSDYKNKKIVAVNCGAIAENLLESELFGTRKGAYTDAEDRTGLFESANGTIIFLDEICELTPAAQVKLLRVLETGSFFRVGDINETKSRFRLITATNKNLKEEMEKGKFREDLFYRITSIIVTIPPLRERREDIPELVEFFLHRSKSHKRISMRAMDKLKHHRWPGNIRELKQVVERADHLSDFSETINEQQIVFY